MSGAQALRSEIVGVLKKDALSIFRITDMEVNIFFDTDARNKSAQLQALQKNNSFLYAKEGTVAGPRMNRYLHSDCLAWVSLLLY